MSKKKISSHTPGPWFSVGAWVEVSQESIADICTCHPEDFNQGHLKRSDAEMMANAQLIAAAPDMLQALKLVRDNASQIDLPVYLLDQVQRAIANAEGAIYNEKDYAWHRRS
jgi:hypothetical protein